MSWIYTMVAAHTLALGVLAILLVPVVRKTKRNRTDFAFLGMLLSLMIWIACNGTSKYLIFFYHLELGFIPAIGGVASLCLGLNFYLVCEFLHQPRIPRHQKKRIAAATIPSIIIAPLFFLNSWISDRVVHDGLIEFHYGPLFLLTSAWILVLVSGGLALLLYRYFRIIRNRRQRAHLRLLLIGSLLSVIFVYVCSVLLPVLGEYRLDNIGPPTTLVLLTLLIYSILTHGFFDLRTFWLRAGLSLVSFVLGGLVLCGFGYWILEHYQGSFAGMKIATLVGLFATGILYGKKVEPWIRSRFFVRRPRAEEIITSLFHSSAGLQERTALDQVLENILQSINRAIPFHTGFIVSMNRNAEARVFHRGRF
ncbi:MAG: hypothetical protein KDK33_11795, partial [Leptospiraceae bacterium]|nr:hypothetical protein [Leptospiraceae bacterium]